MERLDYRRHAVSVAPPENDVASFSGRKTSFGKQRAQHINVTLPEYQRMMSVSDEANDPRMRGILFPLNIPEREEEENSGWPLTQAQVNGT